MKGTQDQRVVVVLGPSSTNIDTTLRALGLLQADSDLGEDRTLKPYRLRECAHTLGPMSHWLTKSPYWSATLTALRQARHDYQVRRVRDHSEALTTGHWTYNGTGHRRVGDTWLAGAVYLNRRTR